MYNTLVTPEVVDKIFENLGEALPHYVPAMPSIYRGLVVTIIISLVGLTIAYRDKKENEDSKDVIVKTRWVVVLLVFVYMGVQIGDIVKDKHYTIECLRLNKQHFANVHWLKEYVAAIK